jgi:large subunit ribosomal protein L29
MNLEKIREMTEAELNNELKKMKNELFNLRFQHVTGQLENPIKMRDVKRNIARVKTVIREKELVKEQQSIG